MSACIKRSERSQINDQMLHPILLGKQEQAKSKTSRRREIKNNEIETKKLYKESMKQKASSLKK
jgi:hypothetical protein